MSHRIMRAVAVTLGLCGFSFGALAATPQEVDKAIKKGVEFLYSRQNDKGNWDTTISPGPNARKEASKPESGQFGGFSALAAYALLDAGESWKDKRVREAVEWINKAP